MVGFSFVVRVEVQAAVLAFHQFRRKQKPMYPRPLACLIRPVPREEATAC